jgi:hypothetical protein
MAFPVDMKKMPNDTTSEVLDTLGEILDEVTLDESYPMNLKEIISMLRELKLKCLGSNLRRHDLEREKSATPTPQTTLQSKKDFHKDLHELWQRFNGLVMRFGGMLRYEMENQKKKEEEKNSTSMNFTYYTFKSARGVWVDEKTCTRLSGRFGPKQVPEGDINVRLREDGKPLYLLDTEWAFLPFPEMGAQLISRPIQTTITFTW